MTSETSRTCAVRRSVLYRREALGFDDAYDRWRAEVADPGVYEVSGVGPDFHFGWDAVLMPEASLTRIDAVGMNYARNAARVRADGFDGVKVQLTHQGGFNGLAGERDVAVAAGTAIFIDQTLPFFNHSADTRCRVLALPRRVFGDMDVRALHGRVVSDAAFTRLDDWFSLQSRALPGAPASALERVTAAMGAVVRGTFESATEPELQSSGALDDLAMARLRVLAVDPRRSAGREAGELARAVGVSRSALYRAAAPFGGVMEVVWAARLDAAHAALLDDGRPRTLSDLAVTLGFHDAAHLQRRFRDRYGFKPGDLRPIRT